MAGDEKRPSKGRLRRFGKLAGASARLGADVLARSVKRLAGRDEAFIGTSAATKLVATLGDLKGAAMKLGQALSMDPGLLPPEVRAILARLQNQAPPMGFEEISDVVRDDLGAAPEELFERFDRQPMAAASLGQVHRALFRGREVAVKVQYPGIFEALAADVENLGAVVNAIRRTTLVFDGREYFAEMRAVLMDELDYVREADSCDMVREAVRPLPELAVPEVFRERSGKRVLTLELLPGPTLGAFFEQAPSPEERLRVSRLLIRAVFGPFLAGGIAHGDPHPGNYVVMPDGRLGILDFGAVKRLSPGLHRAARELFRKAARGEPYDPLEACRSMGFRIELPDEEARELIREVLHFAGRSLRTDAYDFSQDTTVLDMKRAMAKKMLRLVKIRPPPEMVLLGRAVGGLALNLRQLGARGDFRGIYRELADLP